MSRNATFRLLVLGLLLCWCGLFLRGETSDKSMVRAMLVEQKGSAWNVGLLYQFPEAAADSSEADASVKFCFATGVTLERAQHAAESQLPQKANYRLCDYLLISTENTTDVLEVCTPLVQNHTELRVAVRVFAEEFGCDQLAASVQKNKALPEALLSNVKALALTAPHLYEQNEGLLLPVLEQDENGIECKDKILLLSKQGVAELSADKTQMALLLLGRGKEHSFWLNETLIRTRRAVYGVEKKGDGFLVHLNVQPKTGTTLPTAEQQKLFEALCAETIQTCWEQGLDLLSLDAVQALKTGTSDAITTKNACPQLWVDVAFWM